MKETKTQQIKEAYWSYKRSSYYHLYDCYKTVSEKKIKAFDECRQLQDQYNGANGKIVSYNVNQFSYGFIGEIHGKSAFFYITATYNRYIYLENL